MTKVRAGTAYGCQFAQSGCNGPKEGQCMNLCLHRLPIDFAHSDEEEQAAKDRERLHAYHRAMRNSIQPTFADQIAAEEVDESDDFSSARGLGAGLRCALAILAVVAVVVWGLS